MGKGMHVLCLLSISRQRNPSIPNHQKRSKDDIDRIICTSEPTYLQRGLVMMVRALVRMPAPPLSPRCSVFPSSRRQKLCLFNYSTPQALQPRQPSALLHPSFQHLVALLPPPLH